MSGSSIIAFDVGGANIKSVTSDGVANSISFPMWKQPDQLADALNNMMLGTAEDAIIVATMTGELADCFATKAEGVSHIVSALEQAAGHRSLHLYLTDGQFVSSEIAREKHQLAAASNWHALAAYVASRDAWRNSLLIDIGSTTCDLIPIVGGQVSAVGQTDTQRLVAGELTYLGIERTPIACLVDELPYRNQLCPIARELFATTLDMQLILNRISEQVDNCDTADGRPATREFAIARLGRCLCADEDEWTDGDAVTAASYIADRTATLLFQSISRVYELQPRLSEATIVISGHGESLLEPLFENRLRRGQIELLRDIIGPDASRSAPAYALVQSAERLL